MRTLGIVVALTADRHFADAGFTRLLAAPRASERPYHLRPFARSPDG